MEVNKAVTILHVGKLVTAQRECLCVVRSMSPREALVRTSVPMTAGESVTLGLRNGFSVPAVVGMNIGDHVSLLFEEHIAIATIIAEQRNGRSEREAVRLNIFTPVMVLSGVGTHACMMQDISLFGVRLLDETGELKENMQVQLTIEGLGKRDAMVRWREDAYVGLSFEVALGFKLLDEWTAQITA